MATSIQSACLTRLSSASASPQPRDLEMPLPPSSTSPSLPLLSSNFHYRLIFLDSAIPVSSSTSYC
ncbi:hypothetical protein E2C01_097654 [Portunus trituberculatus]|uniref:Uncharacterized protein n=1 Tax=Portunus trituberculatus TaxID=210409 RepID=A0A5B7K5E3_PORTR|nr:hypothetical protein [Portunus trituberculatus]